MASSYIPLLLVLSHSFTCYGQALNSSANFLPRRKIVGNVTTLPDQPFSSFTLTPDQPLVTLDYGYEVAGYPFFDISALSGEVQMEVKYAEDLAALDESWSDGPFNFAVGLTNTYRTESFAVNETGRLSAYLSQGGQRWQSIKAITEGNITFSTVGFKETIAHYDLDHLPGRFTSSNQLYNDVWKLGARAVTAACFDAGVYKEIWEISTEDGAFVRGMRPPLSTDAAAFSDYTLEFATKIERGGSGWAQAFSLPGISAGVHLNLVGDYPESHTFVNTNKTLLPPNTVVVGYGSGLVNQTTLTSYYLGQFPVPFEVLEGAWHNVSASFKDANILTVFIDGTKVLNISLNHYYTGTTGSITTGSFGFGGWQDQAAYVRNVSAYASNGTLIYRNPMTDPSRVLPEFGVMSNNRSLCVDGPKRDRLVWLGDFTHTSKIIGASTGRKDYVRGTLQTFADWQLPSGQLPISPPIGYPSTSSRSFASGSPLFYPLADYHIFGLIAFSSYIKYSGDVEFATESWPKWKLAVDWLVAQVNNSTKLIDLSAEMAAFSGSVDGMSVNAASLQSITEFAQVADFIGDFESSAKWYDIASILSTSINKNFWSEELGVYKDNVGNSTSFSVAGIAFALTSGVADRRQANSSVDALSKLLLGPGYKDATTVEVTSAAVKISPNLNGFLLPGLIMANRTAEASFLIENLWAAMISNVTTNSGASWEYVDNFLQPGLGYYTSLSHPWGGTPTYVLPEYVVGMRPVDFGYKTWIVEPAYRGFNLTSASAQSQTPYGVFSAAWKLNPNGTCLEVHILAPNGTSGSILINRAYGNTSQTENQVTEIMGGQEIKLRFEV